MRFCTARSYVFQELIIVRLRPRLHCLDNWFSQLNPPSTLSGSKSLLRVSDRQHKRSAGHVNHGQLAAIVRSVSCPLRTLST